MQTRLIAGLQDIHRLQAMKGVTSRENNGTLPHVSEKYRLPPGGSVQT